MATSLSCQEALRTLGTLLDCADVDEGAITLSPGGAEVAAPSWPRPAAWTWSALEREATRQRGWRKRSVRSPLPWARRRSHELRAVGAGLDQDGELPAAVVFTPSFMYVIREGARG